MGGRYFGGRPQFLRNICGLTHYYKSINKTKMLWV
nr:MAG TPA: hypothetical protein [Microviridae sp.]